jgi:hypothetical protein
MVSAKKHPPNIAAKGISGTGQPGQRNWQGKAGKDFKTLTDKSLA